MCFTPPHPKPIQSLGWLFLVDEGGSQPGIYMPGSWRRCAPLPLHHCISHFSTLAHNGAKLVIVTTQEPTPIPQKGEMRKVVADYFVRRFPWKTPNQWPETSCENDTTFRLVSSECWQRFPCLWVLGQEKPAKNKWEFIPTPPLPQIASWVFSSSDGDVETFFWISNSSLSETSFSFNWETRKRIWSLQNEGLGKRLLFSWSFLGGRYFQFPPYLLALPPLSSTSCKNQATGKKHLLH